MGLPRSLVQSPHGLRDPHSPRSPARMHHPVRRTWPQVVDLTGPMQTYASHDDPSSALTVRGDRATRHSAFLKEPSNIREVA